MPPQLQPAAVLLTMALCLPSTLSLQIQFPSGLVLVGGGKQFILLKYLWLNFCSSVVCCTDIKATVFIICAQFYYSLCNIQFNKTQIHKIIVRIHTGLCSLQFFFPKERCRWNKSWKPGDRFLFFLTVLVWKSLHESLTAAHRGRNKEDTESNFYS